MPNAGSVAVITLLLGWTLVGWAVAIAMAVRSVPVTEAAQEASPVHAATPARPVGSGLATEIEQLAQLHQDGVLSDDEFTAAKLALSAGSADTSEALGRRYRECYL